MVCLQVHRLDSYTLLPIKRYKLGDINPVMFDGRLYSILKCTAITKNNDDNGEIMRNSKMLTFFFVVYGPAYLLFFQKPLQH